MAIGAVDNIQNLHLLILVSWWLAFTSIVVGHSLQILHCCRLSALVGQKAPSCCLFLFGIDRLCSKGVMFAIDIASTQRFNSCTLDQWPLVRSATRSVSLWQLILALLILLRISCLYYWDLSSWHIPQPWYYPGHIQKCSHSLFYG